jgi:parallel beta-helix repeat protein
MGKVRFTRIILVCWVLFGLAAATSAPTLAVTPTLTVTPSSATRQKGQTVQLQANKTGVKWSSSNAAIATVSTTGLVRAIALGKATIVARVKNEQASSAISVVAPPPPLTITCPTVEPVTAESSDGAVVTWPLPTTTGGVQPVTVSTNPASGSTLPVGTTTVTGSASSSDGQSRTCTFPVTVNAPPPPDYCPTGSVEVTPGMDMQLAVNANPTGTTFCLKAGTHVQQTVIPKTGNTFVGEPGAIMDGEDVAQYAFQTLTVSSTGVTIRSLEITRYASPYQHGAITGDNGTNWLVEDLSVHHNRYIGIRSGPGWIVRRNKVYQNGVVGITGFRAHGTLIEANEVYENNASQAPETPALAAASGMKFGETGTLTIRNNYVHHNFAKGIWIDHCRSGNLVTGNTATDNVDDGILVEVSAQTRVTGNTVERNAIGKGFPSGGIKVTSSRDVEIDNNIVRDNARGIMGNQSVTMSPLPGETGTVRLENLNVHHNTIRMLVGITGLASTAGNPETFTTWNNRFSDNTYFVPSDTGAWWFWDTNKMWTEWQGWGQDVTGSMTVN